MCVGSNDSPAPIKETKPVFIHNPYLDEKENGRSNSVKIDRSSLVIPLLTGIGFEGRGGTADGSRAGPAGSTSSPAGLTIRPSPSSIAPPPGSVIPDRPPPYSGNGPSNLDDIANGFILDQLRDRAGERLRIKP